MPGGAAGARSVALFAGPATVACGVGCSSCVGVIVVELGGEAVGCSETTAPGSAVAADERCSEGCPGLQ